MKMLSHAFLSVLFSVAMVAAGSVSESFAANAARNGVCVGFAGTHAGSGYAGLKCYLKTSPGEWVIRMSVSERDDAARYRQLLRLPKRPRDCTLTEGTPRGEFIPYKVSNC